MSVHSDRADGERAKVIASVSFYLVAALVMVMGNKWVLNASSLPMLLLIVQMLATIFLLHLVAMFKLPFGEGGDAFRVPTVFAAPKSLLPTANNWRTMTSTLRPLGPVLFIHIVGLIFNTYCLQYVSASLFQMVRGLGLPFTVLLSYVFLEQTVGRSILLSCGLVFAGFLVGAAPNAGNSVSLLAVLLGLSSSLCIAAHGILIKQSFTKVTGTLELAYYINFYSSILLVPFALLTGEIQDATRLFAHDTQAMRVFIGGGLLTGLFGFLICIASLLSVKVTSPITHMVSSAVKGVMQILLGMWLFGDSLTLNQSASILLILLGSAYYTWVKEQELRERTNSNLKLKAFDLILKEKSLDEEKSFRISIDLDSSVTDTDEDQLSLCSPTLEPETKH